MADPFLNEPVTHAECRCQEDQEAIAGLDSWGAASADRMQDATCECPCEKCTAYRAVHAGIVRRAKLELKLAIEGVDIGDLADLLWRRFFEHGLERWMKRRVSEMFRGCLVKLRLRSTVSISNESITQLDDEDSK